MIVTGFAIIVVIILGLYLKSGSDQVIRKKIDPNPDYIWYCQGCAWNRAHTFISCQVRRSIKGEKYAKEAVVRTLCNELKLGEYGKECNEKLLFRLKCGKEKRRKKR